MQHAIVLGVSMMVTVISLGFVAPESGCTTVSCFAPLCAFQPSALEQDGDRGLSAERPSGNDRLKARGPRGTRNCRPTMDEMPPMMLERVMEIAKEIDPELADRLSEMCQDDPEAFNRLVRRQGRRLGSLIQLRESDPDLFEVKLNELKIDAEISLVTKSIRVLGVDEAVSQAQIATLRGLVRAKIAFRLRVQTLSIDRLEKHIAALREKIADTSARFDEVVEEKVQQLLNSTKPPPSDK